MPGSRNEQFPARFFLLAFVLTWLTWLPGLLARIGIIVLPLPFIAFFFVGTWGPFAAASWCTYQEGGRKALRAFWRRGLNARFPLRWWLVIFLLPLLVAALPLGLHLLAGGSAPEDTLLSQPWMILPVFLTYFFTGGGNEEWGWRGYALDRLQSRWSPLGASLLLGVIWGAWHIPLFFIEETGQFHMSLLAFLLAAPSVSILHSWVYNKTGGNFLAAWILHSALGTAWEIFPIVQPGLAGYTRVHLLDLAAVSLLALIVLLIVGPQLGLQASSEISKEL